MTLRADPPTELYQAVLNHPDEDAPRLDCADWYEQNLQADRARFIRAQCQAARFLPGDPREAAPSREADRVLWQHHKNWIGNRPFTRGLRWHFLRGFPEHVEFESFKALQDNRADVFAHFVRRISFNNLRSIARLSRCDVLTEITQLSLRRCHLDNDGLRVFASSPYLGNLTWLDLTSNEFGNDGIAHLVESSHLTSLTHLELFQGGMHSGIRAFGSTGMRLLANWPRLAGIRVLGLQGCGLGDEGLAALAASPYLNELVAIDLRSNGITRTGMAALADSGCWPRLRQLRLSSNRLGDEGVIELARARQFTNLTVIDLSDNHVGDPGLLALINSNHLSRLEVLSINLNAVGTPGAIGLANSLNVSNLVSLQLTGNLIGDEGGWALGRSAHLPALRALALASNAIQPPLQMAVARRFSEQNPEVLDTVKLEEAPKIAIEVAPPPPLPQTDGAVDEDALWQAIVDDPDDDLPRLVYSDWLDENGQSERAELIRIQSDPVRQDLTRERQLIEKYRADWLGPLQPHVERVHFDRGLMCVTVSMRTFLTKAFQSNAPAWLRQARVSGLELLGTTKDWSKVADSPVLAAVHEMYLGGSVVGRLAVPALSKSVHLTSLHTLGFNNTYLNSIFLANLLNVEHLPRLRRLSFDYSHVRQDHFQVLIRWPGSARLTSLSFRRAWMGPADASILFTSPMLGGLRHLDLYSNQVGDSGVRALAESPYLTGLTRLDLSSCSISSDGALALADSPVLDRIEYLSLMNNLIGDEGALALARSPRLGRLRLLSISQAGLSNECVEELGRLLGERLGLGRYRAP